MAEDAAPRERDDDVPEASERACMTGAGRAGQCARLAAAMKSRRMSRESRFSLLSLGPGSVVVCESRKMG